MKLLKELMDNHSKHSKGSKDQTKIHDLTKGPNLRSRKVKYCQEQVFHQSEMIEQQNEIIEENQAQRPCQIFQQNEKQEKINPNSQKQLQQNIKKQDKQMEDDNDYQIIVQYEDQDIQRTTVKRKKRQCRITPVKQIFFYKQYKKVLEIDFMIYFKMLSKGKMYSTMLTNQYGQVLFSDRLASQHFQGSLNNLTRNPIYTMILQCKREQVLKKFQLVDDSSPLISKLIIYSKNSKRRYSKSPAQLSMTNQDIFHRYLKCVSCQIIPIEVKISDYSAYQGFWNFQLFQKDLPLRCYLFKTRLSKKMPSLDDLNLNEDKKILKFIKYTKRKKAEIKNNPHNKQQFFNKNFLKGPMFSSMKQDEQYLSKDIFQQMNDQIKHTKSSNKRDWVISSGGGNK